MFYLFLLCLLGALFTFHILVKTDALVNFQYVAVVCSFC